MRSLKITSLFIYLQSSKDAVHCTKYYCEVEIQENMYHKSIVKEKKKKRENNFWIPLARTGFTHTSKTRSTLISGNTNIHFSDKCQLLQLLVPYA